MPTKNTFPPKDMEKALWNNIFTKVLMHSVLPTWFQFSIYIYKLPLQHMIFFLYYELCSLSFFLVQDWVCFF